MTKNECYQGWSNYATWAVALWIDNDQNAYQYWREQLDVQREQAPRCEQVRSGIWTVAQAVQFSLADQLCTAITEASPLRSSTLYTDLLTASIQQVNWTEIAGHWMAEIEPMAAVG